MSIRRITVKLRFSIVLPTPDYQKSGGRTRTKNPSPFLYAFAHLYLQNEQNMRKRKKQTIRTVMSGKDTWPAFLEAAA